MIRFVTWDFWAVRGSNGSNDDDVDHHDKDNVGVANGNIPMIVTFGRM